ncbi:TetR/AcrR family transcriptional regulator [Pseudonocardia lacus]|uniref:TetR/AcrR family transcriptional regulator n=1 Tax=Pseudonocardia lacus TaxID=2835865 RepID=UPI001BDBBD82|nr:TetR/AcrR family transcriptional regulator [Pseudonocardia lacus]
MGRETGLRELKKARTKTAIQRHALRLFREQGFHATTVEQIAAAAEVAPSTVFRYFESKEDLAVLADYLSMRPRFTEVFTGQPAELNPVQALRRTMRTVFAEMEPEERAARYERDLLWLVVPELWGANLGTLTGARRLLNELVAQRVGRGPDDAAVRALTDALVGVTLGVLMDCARTPGADPAAAVDAALAQIETGLPF